MSREAPFCPEGQCPICGSHIFTKEERKEQTKLAIKIVKKIKREQAEKKLPKCYEKVFNGVSFGVDFCEAKPKCHFCSNPYACVIPHYLRHLLLIDHNEDEQ